MPQQSIFLHRHPYRPFLFPEVNKLIVGTLPPPRFTTGELKEGDVDFCYGSRDGQLWKILDRIFQIGLRYESGAYAVEQRKKFLIQRSIGICDIVESAEREKIDATDMGMKNVELRDLIQVLYDYPEIHTLIFTGGNSKNGPEYFFRRLIKNYGLQLSVLSNHVPRIHELKLPVARISRSINRSKVQESILDQDGFRVVRTISLTAPSGSANRAVGSMKEYQEIKIKNPDYNTLDFRVEQYRPFF